MDQELITVKQLPIIEDQLLAVKASIESRVKDAMALVCTEENYKDVKKVRSDLNKEFQEMEKRRKEVKASIMAPYDQFEKVYKECAADIYANADKDLKAKINEVEDGLKAEKAEALEKYFSEYRESLHIAMDFVSLKDARIQVGLSDSLTSLKKRAAAFLDGIASDLLAIEAQQDKDEIMTEYRQSFDLAASLATVSQRHQAIEAQKKAREEAEARRQAEAKRIAEIEAAAQQEPPLEVPQMAPEGALSAPVAMDAPVEDPAVEVHIEVPQVYTTTFTVTGTIEQLKALKNFLMEGGYQYE